MTHRLLVKLIAKFSSNRQKEMKGKDTKKNIFNDAFGERDEYESPQRN